jgi:hypothetical protein
MKVVRIVLRMFLLLAPCVSPATEGAAATGPTPAVDVTPISAPTQAPSSTVGAAPTTSSAPAAASAPVSSPASSPTSTSTALAPALAPGCAAANLRIVGPRTKDRPLPLLSGDGTRGFRPACSVPWTVLSPSDAPLPVEACYRDNLLQIADDRVCGATKGKLWVSARWVRTSAARESEDANVVVCQQLETGAYAATRSLKPPCVPGNPPPAPSAAAP